MTINLRAVPQPHALGSLVPKVAQIATKATISPVLRDATFSKTTNAIYAEDIAKVAFGNVARDYFAIDEDLITRDYTFAGNDLSRFDFTDLLKGGGMRAVPQDSAGKDPFLHVRLDIPSGSSWATYHYSDIDRPVGKGKEAIQLDGRVLDLAYCGRRMSPGGGLARMSTTLRLANNDAELNKLFRDPTFLRAQVDIRVGFRNLSPKFYRRIGPLWRVDRVSSITASYIELALIDATDSIFGEMIEPPTVAALLKKFGAPPPEDSPSDDPHLPVPFGDEWVKPIIIQTSENRNHPSTWSVPPRTHEPSPADALRICVGVTKNIWACPGRVDAASMYARKHKFGEFRVGILSDNETTRQIDLWLDYGAERYLDGMDLYFYPEQVRAPDGSVWYAIIMEFVTHLPTESWKNYTGRSEAPHKTLSDGTFWSVGIFFDEFLQYLKDGRVYVQLPNGVEGVAGNPAFSQYPDDGRHDPASLIEHIVRLYAGQKAYHRLHHPSFEEVRRYFGSSRGVGGTYTYGEDAGSVISAIARTYNLDLWWDADGKLRISKQTFNRATLAEKVPGSVVYDAQWEILRDSWQETIPIGAERWGIANRFNHTGLKDYTRPGFIDELGLDEREDLIKKWGRVLEVDVDWSWFASAYVYRDGVLRDQPVFFEPNRMEQRTVATFYAPLFALELEVGDFIRIHHFAGSQLDTGYEGRLFRVEEVGLEWGGKRVKVVCVDMNYEEEKKTVLFDDDIGWNRIARAAPDGKHEVGFTAGSKLVDLIGDGFRAAGIKVGDLILHDEDDSDRHANLEVVNADWLNVRFTTGDDPPRISTTNIDVAKGHIQLRFTPDTAAIPVQEFLFDLNDGAGAEDARFYLQRQSSGRMVLGVRNHNSPSPVLTWEAGREYVFRVEWDATGTRLYRDGIFVYGTTSTPPATLTGWGWIGRAQTGFAHQPLTGTIRELNPAIVVDTAPTFTANVGTFKVQRTKLDPPTDAEFPGRYKLGSDIYVCASEGGTFSNGLPGFTFEGK